MSHSAFHPVERRCTPFIQAMMAWAGTCLCLYLGNLPNGACPAGDGCSNVLQSGYAHPWGIPLTRLGLLYYGSMLGLTLLSWGVTHVRAARRAARAALIVSVAAALVSAGLLYTQTMVIRALCPFCLASALLSLGLVATAWILDRSSCFPDRASALQFGILGLCSLVVLLIGSPFWPKDPDPVVARIDGASIHSSELDERTSFSTQPLYEGIFYIQQDALERLIGERILTAEAARLGTEPRAYVKSKVTDQVAVTDDEVRMALEGKGIENGSEAWESTRAGLVRQREAELRSRLVKALRSRHEVQMLLPKPIRRVVNLNTAGMPLLGPQNAPVKLVVFSDFECPFCAQLAAVIGRVMPQFEGQVSVCFLCFPLEGHSHARLAAKAAACADAQHRFWPFHDRLFRRGGTFRRADLDEVAREAGLNIPLFQACMQDPGLDAKVEAAYRTAVELGLDSTPSVFLNGQLIGGMLQDQQLAEKIQQALNDTPR